ncbi:MAG: type II toxin-antitoxin system prevent-host-death family antitoxin [Gemmatimonadota bacterium]
MTRVTIHVAKTTLSRLIEKAVAGGDVVIARGSEPVVRLVPVDQRRPRRRFGALKGVVVVPGSFFEPLPKRELDAWK